MAHMQKKGIKVSGRLEKDNLTVYTRCGKIIMRSATSEMPRSRTREQFISRQRVARNANLWKALRASGNCLFAGGSTAYARYCSLMRKMPEVFMTKEVYRNGGALLLPGMPVSDGILPDIGYQWGEVEGAAAIVTSIRVSTPLSLNPTGTDMVRALCGRNGYWKVGDTLRLYTLVQTVENMIPNVYVRMEEALLAPGDSVWRFANLEPRAVEGRLALVGNTLADRNRGWALVHRREDRSSSQGVLTRCTMYEPYTTEIALLQAAESYGGLTGQPFLTPGKG